jgi:hypothetical protein
MPHGFYTVEKWMGSGTGKAGRWKAIIHLDAYQSLAKAIDALGARAKPGLYRVVQTQRCIWAQRDDGVVRLHGSHVVSAAGLARLATLYDREGGRRPVERARRDRIAAKAKRSRAV